MDYAIERSLPVNVEAERSVLGSILLDAQAIDEAAALGLVPLISAWTHTERFFLRCNRLVNRRAYSTRSDCRQS